MVSNPERKIKVFQRHQPKTSEALNRPRSQPLSEQHKVKPTTQQKGVSISQRTSRNLYSKEAKIEPFGDSQYLSKWTQLDTNWPEGNKKPQLLINEAYPLPGTNVTKLLIKMVNYTLARNVHTLTWRIDLEISLEPWKETQSRCLE